MIDSNDELLSDLKTYDRNIAISKYPENELYSLREVNETLLEIAKKWNDKGFDFDSLYESFSRRENQKNTKALTDDIAAYTKDHPVLMNIASVGTNIIGGIAALPSALEAAVRDATTDDIVTVDTNAPEWALKNATDTVRNTSNEMIFDDGFLGTGKAKELSSFLYSTGMSTADFLATTAVTGFSEPVSLVNRQGRHMW